MNARVCLGFFFKNKLLSWPKLKIFLKFSWIVFLKPGCGHHLKTRSQNRGSRWTLTEYNGHLDIRTVDAVQRLRLGTVQKEGDVSRPISFGRWSNKSTDFI